MKRFLTRGPLTLPVTRCVTRCQATSARQVKIEEPLATNIKLDQAGILESLTLSYYKRNQINPGIGIKGNVGTSYIKERSCKASKFCDLKSNVKRAFKLNNLLALQERSLQERTLL